MNNLWIIYEYGWWLNPTLLQNMSSSIEMMTLNLIWGNKTCSKAPTSDEVLLGLADYSLYEDRE